MRFFLQLDSILAPKHQQNRVLEAPGGVLGRSWRPLGPSEGVSGRLGGVLGRLEASSTRLEGALGCLGNVLGPSGSRSKESQEPGPNFARGPPPNAPGARIPVIC